ncbi:VOC family protein [Nonomuraea sp. NBC_01738]|uniref:VOC family protein n=1 Tax=Nonomuraea sp. NBC_01738 TaxID=2976003 RepID=UPI002E0F324D
MGGAARGEPVDRARGWSHVDPPGFVRLAFQPVPEAKTVKNRLHLDLEVAAAGPAAAGAEELGATRVGAEVRDEQGAFQVMADPEGNEFCFVSP